MRKSLNKLKEKEEDMNGKKGQVRRVSDIRYEWGSLDLVSAGLFLVGLYLAQSNSPIGWLLMGIGILKQFSGN